MEMSVLPQILAAEVAELGGNPFGRPIFEEAVRVLTFGFLMVAF